MSRTKGLGLRCQLLATVPQRDGKSVEKYNIINIFEPTGEEEWAFIVLRFEPESLPLSWPPIPPYSAILQFTSKVPLFSPTPARGVVGNRKIRTPKMPKYSKITP